MQEMERAPADADPIGTADRDGGRSHQHQQCGGIHCPHGSADGRTTQHAAARRLHEPSTVISPAAAPAVSDHPMQHRSSKQQQQYCMLLCCGGPYYKQS